MQNPDLVVNNPILNLGYLTPARNCMFVVVNDTFNSNTLYIIKLLAINKIFCYNWNIITAFRYISKQKMISLNTCQYYNKLQKINNDLDFFITVKKNDTPWFVIILLICPSKRPSEQLCTGHQKARERGGDQEHHGKDSG